MQKSYSQASQDLFVLGMLKNKRNGTFVEIGAYHGTNLSNTKLLESEYDWRGIAFEIDPERAAQYEQERKAPCYPEDATLADYLAYFKGHGLPKRIDYLQLDIEPAEQTFRALVALPLNHYRFSVITYETDVYAAGTEHQVAAYKLLNALGYVRLVKNVAFHGNIFEDWYIDPGADIDMDAAWRIADGYDDAKEAASLIERLNNK